MQVNNSILAYYYIANIHNPTLIIKTLYLH